MNTTQNETNTTRRQQCYERCTKPGIPFQRIELPNCPLGVQDEQQKSSLDCEYKTRYDVSKKSLSLVHIHNLAKGMAVRLTLVWTDPYKTPSRSA